MVLGDRLVSVTIARAWASLSAWQRVTFMSSLLFGGLTASRKNLEEALAELEVRRTPVEQSWGCHKVAGRLAGSKLGRSVVSVGFSPAGWFLTDRGGQMCQQVCHGAPRLWPAGPSGLVLIAGRQVSGIISLLARGLSLQAGNQGL